MRAITLFPRNFMLCIFVWALPVVLYFVRQAIGLGGDLNERIGLCQI